jgi:phage portal protein BeeE
MRDNKGKFTTGNKIASKRNKSYYLPKNDAHTRKLPTEKKDIETLTSDYMPFGDSNDFPQRTSELNRKSPISRSVVSSKRNYIVGQGFQSDNVKFQNFKPNPQNTLRDITSKLAYDKLVTGNAYMEIVRQRSKGVVQFYHKDTTKCRVHKNATHIIVHPDWNNYERYRKDAKVIPLYPNFELIDGYERSIIHIKDYEQEFNYYGIPSNIGAIDAANINYKTNKWNLSRLENAFNSSGILMLQADFSDEDASKFDEDFNTKFIGEGNQGKVLKIVNEVGGEPNSSKFIPITTNEDGNWQTLHTQATEEIIIANQWFASLAGLNVSSGFDTNRIRNDYQIAISTIIPYEQKTFIEVYQRILNDQLSMNLDDLEFINKSPISLVDLTNVHTAIIQLNTEVQEQRMSEDMAKQVLKISFQMSDEELNILFL